MSEFESKPVEEFVETSSGSNDEEETQQAQNMMREVFSSEKPKDAIDGLSSGIGNVSKGVLGGIAMMMAAPIQGGIDGHQSGGTFGAIKGAGTGLVMGVIGGAATAVYGVGTGVAQVGRGVLNSPAAAVAGMEGMDWDDERKDWIFYNLPEDSKKVLAIDEEGFIKQMEAEYRIMYDEQVAKIRASRLEASKQSDADKSTENLSTSTGPETAETVPETESTEPKKVVRDTELYDILGVSPSCTSSELKKAYYIAARANHPDRNPNDADANAKFQKIGDAYTVLSNEQTRSAYDEGGRENVVDAESNMDPRAFFAMVFGTEDFEPLIGELQLAAQFRLGLSTMEESNKASSSTSSTSDADTGIKDDIPPFSMEGIQGFGSEYHRRLMNFLQNQRQVKCAVHLSSKLQYYLDSFSNYSEGDEQGYSEMCVKEVEEMVNTPLGSILVYLIGNAYIEWARSESAIFDKVAVNAKQAIRHMYTKASIGFTGAKSIVNAMAPETSSLKKSLRKSFTGWFGGNEPESEAEVNKSIPETPVDGSEPDATNSTPSDKQTPDVVSLTPEEEKELRSRADSAMTNVSIIAWRFVELDIRATVEKICRKTTHDNSVDDLSRRRRVEALKIRGAAFVKMGKELDSVNEIYDILKNGMPGQQPRGETEDPSRQEEG